MYCHLRSGVEASASTIGSRRRVAAIASPSRVWAVSRTRNSLTCAVRVSRLGGLALPELSEYDPPVAGHLYRPAAVRLHGAFGPIAIAEGLVEAAQRAQTLPGEAHFLLAELALTVAAVWDHVAPGLGHRQVRELVDDVLNVIAVLEEDVLDVPQCARPVQLTSEESRVVPVFSRVVDVGAPLRVVPERVGASLVDVLSRL